MFKDSLFPDFTPDDLSDAVVRYTAPVARPFATTRWIARSCLQKSIRRGETDIAHRAVATLFAQSPFTIWSHLIVIVLEDVGVPGSNLVKQVTVAGRNRGWRHAVGGDWKVASYLITKMCESKHCQAACDLLLRSTYLPDLENVRSDALEMSMARLASCLCDSDLPLEKRGIAALAIGGGLAEGQTHRDANAVFGLLADCVADPSIVKTCHDAWKTCRNEMAFLLPLISEAWMERTCERICNDQMPAVAMVGEVPGYALNQHTWEGGQVARRYLRLSPELKTLLDGAGVPEALQPKTVGNLLFLYDGSCLARRLRWPVGDTLRLPFRTLPLSAKLGLDLPSAMEDLAGQGSVIASLRQGYTTS